MPSQRRSIIKPQEVPMSSAQPASLPREPTKCNISCNDTIHDASVVVGQGLSLPCDEEEQGKGPGEEGQDASIESTPISSELVWSVSLFSLTTILLFADQNLMAPNLTAIAHDFGFTDEERDRKLGGEIAFAFFVLGAPASYVIGCLADTCNRPILFAVAVGIGEGACLATAFCQTYRQLYAARAITGFALAGALPLIYSVLGDMVVARQRHLVGALVGVGTGVGVSLGQGVAGFLGPTIGWRLPFVIISVPALVCALLVLLTVKDPPRGQMEAAAIAMRRQNSVDKTEREDDPFVSDDQDAWGEGVEMAPMDSKQRKDHNDDQHGHVYYHHSPDGEGGQVPPTPGLEGQSDYWGTLQRLLTTPTVLLCLLQGSPGCVPWGIINTFLNDFLSEDKGMTVEAATMVSMTFGLGTFFGLLMGGAGGSFLYARDKRFPAILAGGTAIAGCFPFWFLINADTHTRSPILYIGAVVLGFLAGATGPIVRATLQNVTLPQARGQAFALFNTFDDFGRGLGPVFVSALITFLGGRQAAFNVGVFGWVVCGVVNLLMFFTVSNDEHHVQVLVSAQLTRRSMSNE